MIKSPKLYFSDVGLCLFLLGLEKNSLVGSPIVGSIWENLVFLELRKRNLCRAMSGQFWYYRDSQAREVDIIFVSKGRVHFIETKWTTKPDEKAALKLVHISGLLKSRVVKRGSLTILSRSEDPYRVRDEVMTSSIFDFELPE